MISGRVIPDTVYHEFVVPVPCHPELQKAQDPVSAIPVPVFQIVELVLSKTANLTVQLTVLD